MLHADLVALAALDVFVLPVEIVELELHDLKLRVVCQNTVQHLRAVVEGEADVADLALFFQRKRGLEGAAVDEMLQVLRAQRVHEIEIEIVEPAGFELGLEQRQDIRLGFEEAAGELVCEHVAVARVALCDRLAEGCFAFAGDIAVRGIKIIEARRHQAVDHGPHLRLIHVLADHRQAHEPEAEAAVDLQEEFVFVLHRYPSVSVLDFGEAAQILRIVREMRFFLGSTDRTRTLTTSPTLTTSLGCLI